MLVSHLKKFIYLKTKKTGGTSVEIFLEPYCRNDGGTPEHYGPAIVSDAGIVGHRAPRPEGQTWWSHMPGEHVREKVGEKIWGEYYKFCIVRNPFDRVVSHWWMVLPQNLRPQAIARMDFARAVFGKWVEAVPELPADREVYLIDGKPCIDRTLRYERLQEDLKDLCQHLNLDADLSKLGNYKSEFRARRENFQDYYTPAARARVEKEFDFELQNFGYRFEG